MMLFTEMGTGTWRYVCRDWCHAKTHKPIRRIPGERHVLLLSHIFVSLAQDPTCWDITRMLPSCAKPAQRDPASGWWSSPPKKRPLRECTGRGLALLGMK